MTDKINEIDTPEEMVVEQDKLAGYRKMVVAAIVLIFGVMAVLINGDIPANLLQLLEVLFGGFVVGNVTEHVVGTVRATAEMKYQPTDAPTYSLSMPIQPEGEGESSTDSSRIEDTLSKHTQALDIIQQTLLMIIKKSGLDK